MGCAPSQEQPRTSIYHKSLPKPIVEKEPARSYFKGILEKKAETDKWLKEKERKLSEEKGNPYSLCQRML